MTEAIEQWQEFRRAREAGLTEPRGRLTLTGFHWLPETPTELGALPGRWSTDGEDVFLDASPQDRLTVDGGHRPMAARAERWPRQASALIDLATADILDAGQFLL